MSELPSWARRGRRGWRNTGSGRPAFAHEPGPGQESVWDFPRPPRVDRDPRHVVVRAGTRVIADTRAALRLCETASPPTFYLPPADVDGDALLFTGPGSRCEWKGSAHDFDVLDGEGRRIAGAAWSYPEPFSDYAALAGHLAFYASKLECFVDGERVLPQAGGFYGGWITSELVGPFKGEPGTSGW